MELPPLLQAKHQSNQGKQAFFNGMDPIRILLLHWIRPRVERCAPHWPSPFMLITSSSCTRHTVHVMSRRLQFKPIC